MIVKRPNISAPPWPPIPRTTKPGRRGGPALAARPSTTQRSGWPAAGWPCTRAQPAAELSLGKALVAAGRYDEAASVLERVRAKTAAGAVDPRTVAMAGPAAVMAMLGPVAEDRQLEAAACYELAVVQLQLGQLDPAERNLDRVLHLDAASGLGHFQLGNCAVRTAICLALGGLSPQHRPGAGFRSGLGQPGHGAAANRRRGPRPPGLRASTCTRAGQREHPLQPGPLAARPAAAQAGAERHLLRRRSWALSCHRVSKRNCPPGRRHRSPEHGR